MNILLFGLEARALNQEFKELTDSGEFIGIDCQQRIEDELRNYHGLKIFSNWLRPRQPYKQAYKDKQNTYLKVLGQVLGEIVDDHLVATPYIEHAIKAPYTLAFSSDSTLEALKKYTQIWFYTPETEQGRQRLRQYFTNADRPIIWGDCYKSIPNSEASNSTKNDALNRAFDNLLACSERLRDMADVLIRVSSPRHS